MRKLLLSLSVLFSLASLNATVRIVNSPATLASEYTAAVAGDTLKFTANIVVSATFTISKAIVIIGQGYTLSVPSYGITDGGALATSPSAFRPVTIGGTNVHVRIVNLNVKGGSTT